MLHSCQTQRDGLVAKSDAVHGAADHKSVTVDADTKAVGVVAMRFMCSAELLQVRVQSGKSESASQLLVVCPTDFSLSRMVLA